MASHELRRGRMDEFINKLLDSLWMETRKGNSKAVFFHSHQDQGFSSYMNRYLADKTRTDRRFFRRQITDTPYKPAFFPYLEFLREELEDKSWLDVQKFVKAARIYHFQQEVFALYLSGKVTKRYEEVLPEELEYEKEQVLESIAKLLGKLSSTTPLMLVIENLHLAKASTLRLVRYLMNYPGGALMQVVSFDRNYRHSEEEANGVWLEFLEALDTENRIVEFSTGVSTKELVAEEKQVAPIPAHNLESLVELCTNCYHLMAYKECRSLVNEVYKLHLTTNMPISEEKYLILLHLLGDVHKNLEDYDTALLHYNTLLNYALQKDYSQEVADAYRKIGFIYIKKDQVPTAVRFAQQSLKLAADLKDDMLLFHAYFLLYWIEDKGRHFSLGHWRETYQIIIDMAKKLQMNNTLACYLTNPYGTYSEYTREDKILHDMGIEVARKYGNVYRLATAFQTKGLVAAVKGEYPEAFKYYKKSLRLKKRMSNKLELSYSYNALGFYHYLTEKFPKALDYYNKALECLKTVRDYHEICLTYFNVAAAHFLALQHEQTVDYLEKMLLLLRTLKVTNLKYHSQYGIYCLLAVAYCKLGNYSKAYEYFTQIKTKGLAPYQGKNEEYFLFALLQALLSIKEKRHQDADGYFQEALIYLKKKNDVIKYFIPRFYMEYGAMYKDIGESAKAAELFQTGIDHCSELDYPFQKKILTQMLQSKEPLINSGISPDKTLDFEWVLESAKLEINLTKLHRKISEINFLNNLQTVLVQADDQKVLIDKVMSLIDSKFVVDFSMVHLKDAKGWKCVYTSKPLEALGFNVGKLLETIEGDTQERMVDNTGNEPDFSFLFPAIGGFFSLPLMRKEQQVGNIFCGVRAESEPPAIGELQILSIAVKQLTAALERIERDQVIIEKNKELSQANRQLTRVATTDTLTGLSNRHALLERLGEEVWHRQTQKETESSLAILFIDLDHFKYFNDTFGHQVGDLILYKFADILRSVIREKDFVARFGGDEFVVLLVGATINEAILVADRINQELDKREQFKGEIERYINRKLDIPVESRLSCSVGISEVTGEWDNIDMDAFLQQADKALYLAKKSGRKQYKTWNDLDCAEK